ncbi:MAG: YcxB family protein [Terriglobia bacterium]
MTFEFQPSFGDQYWATLAVIRRSPLLLAVSSVFPVVGIVVTALALWVKTATNLLLIVVPWCFAFTPAITALNLWLSRRRNRTVGGIHTFTLDSHGIHSSSPAFDVTLKWSAINRVAETKRFFLFFFSSQAAQFLPKRVISSFDDLQAIRDLIATNLGADAARNSI